MLNNNQTPATKEDIRDLLETLHQMQKDLFTFKVDVCERFTLLYRRFDRIEKDADHFRTHFDDRMDPIRNELLGTYKDQMQDFNIRLTQVERKVRLVK
jgi:hypothetical protein